MTSGGSVPQLAETYIDISRRMLVLEAVADAFVALTTLGAQVPGAQEAGITEVKNGKFSTPVATGELSVQTDAIQYELACGPCVDAVLRPGNFRTGDLRNDRRWPEFGRRAFETTGVLSMLSVRLYLEENDGLLVGLNMYSREPDAFDDDAETMGVLIATYGSLGLASARAREQATKLAAALENRTDIGVAMGVLMAQHRVTRDDAFNLLRVSSQHTGRKLHVVATEVADTGALPLPSTRPTRRQ
jgi:ANTAR domain-containing protein